MLFWSRMSLKWKISAELIPAGGVKGGEAQLPLALQHGRTDGQTDSSAGARACHAGRAGSGSASGGRKETRAGGAQGLGCSLRTPLVPLPPGNNPGQLSRCRGPPFHLVTALSPAAVTALGAAHGGRQSRDAGAGTTPVLQE